MSQQEHSKQCRFNLGTMNRVQIGVQLLFFKSTSNVLGFKYVYYYLQNNNQAWKSRQFKKQNEWWLAIVPPLEYVSNNENQQYHNMLINLYLL